MRIWINKSYGQLLTIILFVVFALMGYLIISRLIYGNGFPLDDAWIHQTYARNLVSHGMWEYVDGEPSAGSTSPLWTVLLGIAYLFSIPPILWSYLLGGIFLIGVIFIYKEIIYEEKSQQDTGKFFLITIMALEWHFCWAALAGMETIVFIFILLLCFYLIEKNHQPWLLIGLLSGIAIWIRPEGITLLGPSIYVLLLKKQNEKIGNFIRFVMGIAAPLLVYITFNQLLGVGFWPNTFYAKQKEYSILMDTGIFQRLFLLFKIQFIGPGVLLIPGVIAYCWINRKKNEWWRLFPFLWWMGFTCIFALRLPVIYQHGRYMMPAMSVVYLLGLSGWISLLKKYEFRKKIHNILIRTWQIAFITTVILFYFLGAKAYGEDVAIIETEMVKTSIWIKQNTSENTVIAAHDIGALGYFSNRKIIDMAGLITPETIPFISDEKLMLVYITKNNADYLMAFPSQYPELTEQLTMVYTTGSNYSPSAGGQNMAVYRLPRE